MKLQVGKRIIKLGQMIVLSKNGTVRAWRSQHDLPIGIATTELRKGIVAELLPGTTGNYVDKVLYDNQALTKVTSGYFKADLISDKILPKSKRE